MATRQTEDHMEGHLKLLSKELDVSLSQEAPEDHIKRALQAHGFFKHLDNKPNVPVDKTIGITEEDRRRTTQLVSHIREGKEVHTLREPWGLNRHCRGPPKPQWPVELECLPLRPKLISNPPPYTEPFCTPEDCTSVTPRLLSVEGEGGRWSSSTNQSTPNVSPVPGLGQSRFESGNLEKAVKVGPWDYELVLRGDLYTQKHTQWYFFRVQNTRAGQTYRFTIINLYKDSSLYSKGMQPLFYSEADAKSQKVGWRRTGHAIKYFKSSTRRPNVKRESFFYCLTWSHTFQHGQDTCYFAHCYPYTYSDLQDDLGAIQMDPLRASCCKQRTLCHTLAGNPVPILTITSPAQSHEDHKCKRAVVLSARVHPGETNSSWVMKGLLDYLTGQSPDATMLRELFVFKVIPMLNPDGVIAGNYRCSLAGRDLNRNYRSKLKGAYPSIWHTKAMVKRLSEEREILLYCDLHGHSKKQNIFIYGCDNNEDKVNKLCGRVFVKMLSMNAPSKFSYESSKFAVHKSKFGTGRVYMWRELGVRNSYTMEATFCGSLLGKQSGHHFNTADLETMGRHLCDTLLEYCDPDQTKMQQVLREVEEDYRKEVVERLVAMGRAVPKGVDPLDIVLEPEESSSGSDSSVSDGPPLHMVTSKKKKRKKLKSRKERNKHKALLKMTQKLAPIATSQDPMPEVAPPILGEKPTLELTSQSADLEVEERVGKGEGHTTAGSLQEQRHRLFVQMHSETVPNVAMQEQYIETVTQDYAKQTLPMGSVTSCDSGGRGETLYESSRLLHNSTSFLARLPALPILPPLCTLPPLSLPPSSYTYSHPINILPVTLVEQKRGGGGGGSRSSSLVTLEGRQRGGVEEGRRRGSEMSTAQLLTNASCKTAFASQYVATYLSELVTNDAAAGSSRNLSNLSQMFRHLYPQAPRPAHSDSKQSPPLRQPPSKLLLQTDTEHLVSDPSTGQEVDQSAHHLNNSRCHYDSPPTLPQEAPVAPPPSRGLPRSLVPLSSSDPGVTGAQSASLHLSAKDKRVIADIRSSYGGGGSNGGLHNDSTTSWESFVQPARILPKNSSSSSSDVTGVTQGLKELQLEPNQRGSPAAERRGGGLGDMSRLVASGGRRVLIRVEVGGDPGTGGGGNQDGYDLVVSPRRQGRPPRESHQPSLEPRGAPLPLSLPTVNKSDGSNVAAHKRGVAEALQGIHQREATAGPCPPGAQRSGSLSTAVCNESTGTMTRIVSSYPAGDSSLRSYKPSACDGLSPPTVNLKLADIRSSSTVRKREGMTEIAFKYWREKEQSAEVSKKGSKTPPPLRAKPKQIPEKSVLVDLDSSTGKGRFENVV
ncbi:hypothetical protein EMCRGX_G009163 [Ephydatia muelleri]